MANFEHRRKLSNLIESGTKPREGIYDLEESMLQGIKELVKLSHENVKSAYDLMLDQLKAKHAQTRYLAVLLMDYLFLRSKYFRELLVKDLQPFFERAVGVDSDKPLPPPAHWATLTREKSLEVLEKWHDEYGKFYKQLSVRVAIRQRIDNMVFRDTNAFYKLKSGYLYLKHTRKMQFPDLRAQQTRREEQQRAREEKTQRILRAKFETLQKEFDEMAPDVFNTLQQMETAFSILMPDPTISFESDDSMGTIINESDVPFLSNGQEYEGEGEQQYEESDNGYMTMEQIVRTHGLGSASYEMNITINKTVDVTNENNTAVVDILKDCMRMLNNKFVPNAKGWATVLMKFQATQAERATYEALLKKIIDLQGKMNRALQKYVDVADTSKGSRGVEAFISTLGGESDDVAFDDGEGNQLVLVPAKEGYEEYAKDDNFATLEQELLGENSIEHYNNLNNNVNNTMYNLFVNNEESPQPPGYIDTNLTYNFITPKKTPPSSTTTTTTTTTKTTPPSPTLPITTTPTTTMSSQSSSPPNNQITLYNANNNPSNISTLDSSKLYVPYWQRDGPAQPPPQEAKEDKSRTGNYFYVGIESSKPPIGENQNGKRNSASLLELGDRDYPEIFPLLFAKRSSGA